MRWGVTIVLAVWGLPALASALALEGELHAREVRLPALATLDSEPLALFAPDVGSQLHVRGDAPVVNLTVVEVRYATVDLGPARPSFALGEPRRAQWSVHDADIELVGAQRGWVGADKLAGELVETPSDGTSLRSASSPRMGNASASDDEGHPFFSVQLQGDVVLRESARWRFEGAASLKMLGPTLTLRARENTTILETGQFEDPAMPGVLVRRWVQLDLPDARLDAREASAQVASRSVLARWNGGAAFEGTRGELGDDRGRVWTADGGSHTIAGDVAATMVPSSSGVLAVRVEGEVRGTTMTARAPVARGAALPDPLLIMVGTALVGAAASAAVVAAKRRRRAPAVPLHAEEYARLAEEAADARDYARAAELTAAARRRSPTSRRLALDEAFYASRCGRGEEALALLRAPLLAGDPDALLLSARLLLGVDAAAAGAALARALDLAPLLLLEVEDDAELALLFARPEVARALRAARARLR